MKRFVQARIVIIAAALIGALVSFPLTAAAQTQGAACTNKDQAKKDFVKGRLAYRRGDYEEAILKWQDSYAACAKPLTLFNIGNAYERLGNLKEALKHFEQYRPLAAKHEQADLDSRMEGLRTRIAEQDRIEADRKAQEDAARKAEEDRKRREEWERRQKAKGSGLIPIIGWTAVGVGGAAVIAGVVMDAVAASKRPDEAQACTDAAGRLLCRDAQRDDIESSNTLAIAGDVTWIAGSVFAAGGATILILHATGVLKVGAGSDGDEWGWLNIAPYGAGVQAFGSF